MTTYELIQRLAKFPPETRIVHGVDWSDDVVLDDYTGVTDAPPTLALTTSVSSAPRQRVEV